jgi:hypothetical protein
MATPVVLAPHTMVGASKGPVSCVVGEALVILDPATGTYFGTEEVGARILTLIGTPTAVRDVCRAVVDEYEVSEEQAARDVDAFLRSLIERGLAKTCADDLGG